MSINEKLKAAVVKDLESLRLRCPFDSLEVYVSKNYEQLSALHNTGVISDQDIERALEVAVLRQAKKDYKLVTRGIVSLTFPDELPDPIFLAYAIEKGFFSKDELKMIRFDHGETIETFPIGYRTSELLGDLRQRVLTKPKPKEDFFVNEYSDHHPSCC